MTTIPWLHQDDHSGIAPAGESGRMRVHGMVREAVQKKQLLKLVIREHHHIVEPHAYGLNNEGKPALLCYRLGNSVNPVNLGNGGTNGEGWKVITLGAIESIDKLPDTFASPRPGYRRNDRTISAVFAQL
jgi:hypothetical protein